MMKSVRYQLQIRHDLVGARIGFYSGGCTRGQSLVVHDGPGDDSIKEFRVSYPGKILTIVPPSSTDDIIPFFEESVRSAMEAEVPWLSMSPSDVCLVSISQNIEIDTRMGINLTLRSINRRAVRSGSHLEQLIEYLSLMESPYET